MRKILICFLGEKKRNRSRISHDGIIEQHKCHACDIYLDFWEIRMSEMAAATHSPGVNVISAALTLV